MEKTDAAKKAANAEALALVLARLDLNGRMFIAWLAR
jgi:hypothetical protein